MCRTDGTILKKAYKSTYKLRSMHAPYFIWVFLFLSNAFFPLLDLILVCHKAHIPLVDSGFTLFSDLTSNYYTTLTYSSLTISTATGFTRNSILQ